MLLNREKQEKELLLAFSKLSTNITYQNKAGYFDINRSMEFALTTILNKIFNLSLINLNTIKHNHPAIDLGDALDRKAFQITSDGSNKKFNETLDLFIKHNLNDTYDDITFLIISNDQKCSIQRKGFTTTVYNLEDLVAKICNLDNSSFSRIFDYCSEQFKSYFESKESTNLLDINQISSIDPNLDISCYIKSNNIEDIVQNTHSVVRDDLLALKNILSELNDGERKYLHKVLYLSKEFDSCYGFYIPNHLMENNLSYIEKKEIHSIFSSLEYKKLAWYNEEDSKLETSTVGVKFIRSIEDFDYLGGIKIYLTENRIESCLYDIIVNCNFSHIH